jgi:hypothetical protein
MTLKKFNNRFAVYVVLFVFIAEILVSCGPTQYRYYKKMVRRRTTYYGYKSNYQKKLKRNTMPVNKNYVIRNKRTTPAWR